LRLREFIVERITIIKFGVNSRGSNGTGSQAVEELYYIDLYGRIQRN